MVACLGGCLAAIQSMASVFADSCPAGSMLIWTESLVHVGNDWTDPEHDRIATFALYNSLW